MGLDRSRYLYGFLCIGNLNHAEMFGATAVISTRQRAAGEADP